MRRFLFNFSLILALAVSSHSLFAHDHAGKHDKNSDNKNSMATGLLITDAWARATFALAKTGAAYFTASNNTDEDILLSAVSVNSDVAMTAEIHHTVMQEDMMQMQELSDGVLIKAGMSVEFAPGGKHLMLMGLAGPLNKGEFVIIKLEFKDGSHVLHRFPIKDKRNATH